LIGGVWRWERRKLFGRDRIDIVMFHFYSRTDATTLVASSAAAFEDLVGRFRAASMIEQGKIRAPSCALKEDRAKRRIALG